MKIGFCVESVYILLGILGHYYIVEARSVPLFIA